jgi:hypothetical protein
MKPNFLSTFHYLVFLGLVLLLTSFKILHTGDGSTCEKRDAAKTAQINEVPVAQENTTDLLHSELMFKY